MYCSNCGVMNVLEASFCQNCGKELKPNSPE
ncbi:zinc-ribbon domain-containing protein [Methanobacterium sp.]